ncbi:MAG: hypothetical protein KDA33_17735 [Phycisphaerales bacterium]|nr:hypothetical protein [Phycisphaerales bacterium]
MDTIGHDRAPQNAEGDFYTIQCCLMCCAPHHEAPDLMNDAAEEFDQCYFRRQPRNDVELGQAINAVCVSCIESLRYAGRDPRVIARLMAADCGHLCDSTETP